jgi:hypothetical protein
MAASLGDAEVLGPPGVPRVGLVRCLVPVPELDLARTDLFFPGACIMVSSCDV